MSLSLSISEAIRLLRDWKTADRQKLFKYLDRVEQNSKELLEAWEWTDRKLRRNLNHFAKHHRGEQIGQNALRVAEAVANIGPWAEMRDHYDHASGTIGNRLGSEDREKLINALATVLLARESLLAAHAALLHVINRAVMVYDPASPELADEYCRFGDALSNLRQNVGHMKALLAQLQAR